MCGGLEVTALNDVECAESAASVRECHAGGKVSENSTRAVCRGGRRVQEGLGIQHIATQRPL